MNPKSNLQRPKSPGGIVTGVTVVLLDREECVVAKRGGAFVCVRGDHDHIGASA